MPWRKGLGWGAALWRAAALRRAGGFGDVLGPRGVAAEILAQGFGKMAAMPAQQGPDGIQIA